jgi:hypothetical protein
VWAFYGRPLVALVLKTVVHFRMHSVSIFRATTEPLD